MTITDSKGCRAAGSGGFHWRDCTGMLAHTSASCQSFMDGTADPLPSSDVHWATRDDVISTFYFSLVKAPSASFTINIVQTKDNVAFPFIPVMQSHVSECTW